MKLFIKMGRPVPDIWPDLEPHVLYHSHSNCLKEARVIESWFLRTPENGIVFRTGEPVQHAYFWRCAEDENPEEIVSVLVDLLKAAGVEFADVLRRVR